jgi:hypothetical protein
MQSVEILVPDTHASPLFRTDFYALKHMSTDCHIVKFLKYKKLLAVNTVRQFKFCANSVPFNAIGFDRQENYVFGFK